MPAFQELPPETSINPLANAFSEEVSGVCVPSLTGMQPVETTNTTETATNDDELEIEGEPQSPRDEETTPVVAKKAGKRRCCAVF